MQTWCFAQQTFWLYLQTTICTILAAHLVTIGLSFERHNKILKCRHYVYITLMQIICNYFSCCQCCCLLRIPVQIEKETLKHHICWHGKSCFISKLSFQRFSEHRLGRYLKFFMPVLGNSRKGMKLKWQFVLLGEIYCTRRIGAPTGWRNEVRENKMCDFLLPFVRAIVRANFIHYVSDLRLSNKDNKSQKNLYRKVLKPKVA